MKVMIRYVDDVVDLGAVNSVDKHREERLAYKRRLRLSLCRLRHCGRRLLDVSRAGRLDQSSDAGPKTKNENAPLMIFQDLPWQRYDDDHHIVLATAGRSPFALFPQVISL